MLATACEARPPTWRSDSISMVSSFSDAYLGTMAAVGPSMVRASTSATSAVGAHTNHFSPVTRSRSPPTISPRMAMALRSTLPSRSASASVIVAPPFSLSGAGLAVVAAGGDEGEQLRLEVAGVGEGGNRGVCGRHEREVAAVALGGEVERGRAHAVLAPVVTVLPGR